MTVYGVVKWLGAILVLCVAFFGLIAFSRWYERKKVEPEKPRVILYREVK